MSWNKFLTLLGLGFVLAAIAIIAYRSYQESNSPMRAYIAAGPVDHVLAVDLNGDEHESVATTFNQDDVILGIKMGLPKTHIDDLILSDDVINFIRHYSNGTVTSGEPLFNRMVLLYLDKNNSFQVRYAALSSAGTRAVILYPQKATLYTLLGKHPNVMGEVVMADNTKHYLRNVMLRR